MTNVQITRSRGRPRAFDRAEVLVRAMRAFWTNGYEGASIPVLTDAMGISAQSLYAAFGSKDALYREALDVYRTTLGGFGARALQDEADAVDAVARLVRDAAIAFTVAPDAPGCMISMAPADVAPTTLTKLGRSLRAESVEKVTERLERGLREGQVRADADLVVWARYVGGLVLGMSAQARDGATTGDLLATAEIARQSLQALRP